MFFYFDVQLPFNFIYVRRMEIFTKYFTLLFMNIIIFIFVNLDEFIQPMES